MAFINSQGAKISYECEDLIDELSEDILEFGESLEVEVITAEYCGVTIYKDYNLPSEGDPENDFQLAEGETLVRISAVKLLKLYEEQDSVL